MVKAGSNGNRNPKRFFRRNHNFDSLEFWIKLWMTEPKPWPNSKHFSEVDSGKLQKWIPKKSWCRIWCKNHIRVYASDIHNSPKDFMWDFFPNESDDKEDPDPKRVRRGWKKRSKSDYETCMFWIDHRVNMNCHDPTHLDGKEYRLYYRMSWSEVEKIIQLFKTEGWLEVNDTTTTDKKFLSDRD